MNKANSFLLLFAMLLGACTSITTITNTPTPSSTPTIKPTFTLTATVAPTQIPTIKPIEFEVYNISVSPNGEMLVLTASTGVWVYRLSDAKVLFHHKHVVADSWQGLFSFISWSPDGTSLAVGKPNTGVWVWNTATWELRTERDDDPDYVPGFDWSPDGSKLALGGNENEILVWHKEKNTWENKTGYTGYTFGLTWASDEQLQVLGYGGLFVVETGELAVPLDHWIDGLYGYAFWSPNKKYVYIFFDLGGGVMDIGKNKYQEFGSCCYPEVAWSMDGRYFSVVPEHSNEISVWDAIGQKIVLTEKQGDQIYAFAWTPTGDLLAAGSMNGRNVVWNTNTKEILFEISE